MDPNIFDQVVALVLIFAMPVYAAVTYRGLQRKIGAGVPGALASEYVQTMAVEWGLSIAVLLIWFATGRSGADLGLGFDVGPGWWVGAGLTFILIALSMLQARSTLRKPEALVKVRKQLEPVRALLPSTAKEAQLFNALSVTAGICEELLYRGFMIAYIAAFVDMWLAVVLSSVAFGLGHIYQGGIGVLKTGAVGLALAGLYVLTGSLWLPMILHAFIDVNSGMVGRRVLAQTSVQPAEAT